MSADTLVLNYDANPRREGDHAPSTKTPPETLKRVAEQCGAFVTRHGSFADEFFKL